MHWPAGSGRTGGLKAGEPPPLVYLTLVYPCLVARSQLAWAGALSAIEPGETKLLPRRRKTKKGPKAALYRS
jgi:hypothetical protein